MPGPEERQEAEAGLADVHLPVLVLPQTPAAPVASIPLDARQVLQSRPAASRTTSSVAWTDVRSPSWNPGEKPFNE